MNVRNAWIAIERESATATSPRLSLQGATNLHTAILEDDWILVVTPDGEFIRAGHVLRIRAELEKVTVYFDRLLFSHTSSAIRTAGLSLPESGSVSRLQWNTFVDALLKITGKTVEESLLIKEDQAYIRDLLQLAVMDDLLGPANGPHEQIVDMNVRDRYLVGKLAPMKSAGGGIEGLEGPLAAESEDGDPGDIEVHKGRHEPGSEFGGATGRIDAEAEALDEIDVASNQSLVPSSLGMTFCVNGDIDAFEVEARWGRYERDYEIEIYKKRKNSDIGEEVQESKAKVWKRVPCGGSIVVDLLEGLVSPQAPDSTQPAVRIQGTVRGKNANGDRLVTLFVVNAQEEPGENKDSAWIFQPELIVRAPFGAKNPAIFRRRLAAQMRSNDPERETLEMIYRRHVEFAVGHGVAVHAATATGETDQAVEVRTVIMPQYEVPVTEIPGYSLEDRPAMRQMVEQGYLDMRELAVMDRSRLIKVLSILIDDYKKWIADQYDRIGTEVVDFDEQAHAALVRCKEVYTRLVAGMQILSDENNEMALRAFRFMNSVMAQQRIRSIYALARRRGEKVEIADFDKRKSRSWRPFQIAFVLLSLPSLADPEYVDRTRPVESIADLLWFPTGGGKTEAYLGVAAFAMAIRRLQGEIGGYDGSRGLTVIMRYTLRLLTLQQFQRATTLICAMEVERQQAVDAGDDRFGVEPFTIGLWVGNKVTPGTTADSHSAIRRIRNSEGSKVGVVSPGQLTSCPWCGSDVSDMRDIEVDKSILRTKIYCGDKKGICEFSKRKSSKHLHPGLPVLVVDEEIYHRPPSMMIATVDKFAMMAWRGEIRTLFGRAMTECPRHGLLWPDSSCSGNHRRRRDLPATKAQVTRPIRPPDLVIQDEFHLISGPLGTMVGLYETAVDELCTWRIDGKAIKPKIIASTATVRKAKEQVNNVFMRRVSIFPPSGLDVTDNFFSLQRPIDQTSGRRYLGVCSPGSSRPAVLIRVYTAFLTAAQALFERFGQAADPYLTTVGYFNSLRELGSMKRLAEDDVQTRCYRVQMSSVNRPGLSQRSINRVLELTSRISNRDIPKYLDQLEVKFSESFDDDAGKFVTNWEIGETRSVDLVLATNMLSVGVDVNRLGLMVVNGQPKGTAEYIQATSRVGRSFPGLVCTVLTWARPRDLSHYETFEHYHATFYKHVEAQSVTPFSPRAMDRGLTGAMLSVLRLESDPLNPNSGAREFNPIDMDKEIIHAVDILVDRAWSVSEHAAVKEFASAELKERIDYWATEACKGGRILAYEKKGTDKDKTVPLLRRPGRSAWDNFTVPMSMREVEPGVRLVMNTIKFSSDGPTWTPPPIGEDYEEDES
ncbi:MAG: helicase [Ectothiorhodospiraceae bacterium AqS1]|nr:helicase [Ectothiorhodospiraceae bacterium AqS1]